ncbi:hypothetical protein KHS38_19290 [Mucilaginibacter sp. Bleaf8]|uniref:hypothetical protein n=1 Tax=Mucilaginibacter sp. Bleaf8 TaxID=2834430 RepID=UPI001BD1AC9E|nr:hypothetical protein [Mucilaginibacter sp. Bleaf8]MBS7566558.1 hypothetical protein [Mucilaginibacter sp. Bleaf8]
MNLRSYLLVSFLLFAIICRAQSNYKSGYVINTKGDTIKGYINYRDWSITPKYIEFKATATDKEYTRYTPGMLQGFVVDGMDRYISYKGRVSMDKNSMPDLPLALDTTVVQDTLFLQLFYAGSPVSMLKQSDQLKQRFFVMDNDNQPVELIFHSYITDNYSNGTAGNTIRGIDVYKVTLKALAEKYKSEDAKLLRAIDYAQFQEWEILSLTKRINNDKVQQKGGNYGSRFFAGTLIKNTATKFDGDVIFNGQSQNTYLPAISVGVDFFTNKHVQKFFFRGELSFTAANPKFNGTVKNIMSSTDASYQFNQYTIALAPQVFYNIYNKENFKFFAGAGVGINYSIYSNNQLTYAGQPITPFDLEKTWINFMVQTGVTVNKKFDVFAMYSPASSFGNYVYFSISNTTYGAGIHYYFNR